MQNNLNKELIFIIDDNEANILVASYHLKAEGFRVESTTLAKNALEMLENSKPNLILLDILMPSISGFELCKQIKSNPLIADIPVIFITALKHTDDMVKGFDYGAVDYIIKPFNKNELVSRVKNHLKLVKQNRTIKCQNEILLKLNDEKNGIIELTAHDLKNPLQAILGFSDILLAKIPEQHHALASYANTIKSSAQKAVNIIKDLTEVNLIEQGKLKLTFSQIDVRDVLIKIIDDYMFLAESKNQKIIYNETDKSCVINSDFSKLERIFDNLISNAIKYSKIGGRIVISCKYLESQGDDYPYIFVSINDDGPGFTDDDKQKIFTKFAKLSAKPTADEASTGLGLSIVKKLTDLLNGHIELETHENSGSTFIMKFPIESQNINNFN